MKTQGLTILICFVFHLGGLHINAQERSEEKQVNINSNTYTVSRFRPGEPNESVVFTDGRRFIETLEVKTERLQRFAFTGFINSQTIESAIIAVLTEARIRELALEKGAILVIFYPDHNGKIKAAEYMKRRNHKITLAELDQINTYVKKNLTYIMPENISASEDIWPITHVIRFRRLIE